MIITKQKPLEDILGYVETAKKVFLVGCSLCATTCKTGGKEDLARIKELLEKEGKTVTGEVVLEPACSVLEVKRCNRKYHNEMDGSDAVISFTCGGGTQAIADIVGGKMVYPGNDTLFQGEITKITVTERCFDQRCSLCGECMLALTGGICPTTRCPKGLLNGPCGGTKNGKCEVGKEVDCAWLAIHERLKERGKLGEMRRIRAPRDHSRNRKPQRIST